MWCSTSQWTKPWAPPILAGRSQQAAKRLSQTRSVQWFLKYTLTQSHRSERRSTVVVDVHEMGCMFCMCCPWQLPPVGVLTTGWSSSPSSFDQTSLARRAARPGSFQAGLHFFLRASENTSRVGEMLKHLLDPWKHQKIADEGLKTPPEKAEDLQAIKQISPMAQILDTKSRPSSQKVWLR